MIEDSKRVIEARLKVYNPGDGEFYLFGRRYSYSNGDKKLYEQVIEKVTEKVSVRLIENTN